MDRRKVIEEAISTLQLKEELDWDRLLWMPGEKKFFLPSIEPVEFKPSIFINLDYDKVVLQLVDAARLAWERPPRGNWEGFCDECNPTDTYRDDYLAVSREQRPVTYNDIRRSVTPIFRGSQRYRNFK